MFDITLENGRSVATMAAVAAAAVLLTALFYRRAFGMLRRRQWQLLLALRVAAILVVVLLLFRPVLSYYKISSERPAVVFLVDRSASMSIADDPSGLARFDQARRQVEAWWKSLEVDFDLRAVSFAERAEPLGELSQLALQRADGKATSLSRGLVAAARLLPRRDDAAVVLLSDGVHNSAVSPIEIASRLGVVVHTVGVGAGLRSDVSFRDVQVVGWDCPDRMRLNNIARLTASVEAVGLPGRVVRVVLEEDDQPVDEKELTLDEIEGPQAVVFEFRPTVKGRHRYTVRVPAVGEETIQQNNARSATAAVVEPGIRVLYIEGTLRAEYGALVDRFLAKDPDVEFCALVQTRPNVFLKRTNMGELSLDSLPNDRESIEPFDVFILGDLDSSYLSAAQQALLLDRVRAGAGLVMLGGYHSLGPGGYGGSPLGEALPVRVGGRDISQVTESFLPQLTPEGAQHAIFANIADFFPTATREARIAGLPPLAGCTRVESARPGASVLATCPVSADNFPVLAVQPLEKGRTAVFTGDTTRAWQQGPVVNQRESPFLRFWGQLVRWLAGRPSEVSARASVAADTDKAVYAPDEPIQISAVVRNADGEGAAAAKVQAKILGPGGRQENVDLTAQPGPGGHYRATFEPKTGGSYEITVEARLDESTLESAKLAVEVGRPNLEFEKLDLDEQTLVQIADDTGGRYVHLSTADSLIDQFRRTAQEKREYLQARLYWPPAYWLLFVSLLTTEWVLRRRFLLR